MKTSNLIKNKIKIFYFSLISLLIANSAIANTPINQQTEDKPKKVEKLNYKSITELRKILKENENKSTKDKIIAFSSYFQDKPYDSSLGEKLIKWDRKRNKKKLIELERFDCLSYLETLIALSEIKNVPDNNKDLVNQFSESLSSIMFAVNDVTYTGRNHFLDTEWVKNNQRLINNITDDLAYAKERSATIDKAQFLDNQIKEYAQKYVKEENREKFINKFQKDIKKFIPVESKVKYISFKDFLVHKEEIEKLISDKICLFTMIADKPELVNLTKSEHNVGHVGFIYMKEGKMLLDHASLIGSKAVEVIEFENYAKEKAESSSLIGFSLYELK